MKNLTFIALLLLFIKVNAQNPLAVPGTLSGSTINLTIKDTAKTWYTGQPTNTIGINSDYLGPTLILNKWETVQFHIQNLLIDTTTMHWHGLHVSPQNDGGPHTTIPPSTVWSPNFPVLDVAGTYWYHAHLHMKTAEHVTKGLAGMIIVRDSAESQINLPRSYGEDEFPLVIQSRHFDLNKQFVTETVADSVMMVNGTLNPFLDIPAQVIRFRLLNGATDRTFNIGFQNNLTFYHIASDGGLLSQPVALTRLRIAPGERAEILLNVSGMQAQQINMISFNTELPAGIYGAANPSAMGPGVITGYTSNPLNGNNFNILQLNVVTPTANPVTTIPNTLVIVTPLNPTSATSDFPITITSQTIGPNGMVNGPFLLNNQPFNMNVINRYSFLNNVETWTIQNNTSIAHPFHVHGLQFYIVSRNGIAPVASEAGRKDVVLVHSQETVVIILKWEDFTDNMVPYMYHCHMLTHEEHGMMGQVIITDPSSVSETGDENEFVVFPNPSSGEFFVEFREINNANTEIKIFDLTGRIVHTEKIDFENGKTKIILKDISAGIYCLSMLGENEIITRKIIIVASK